ncbi:hypothetical protein D8B26_002105 [Coccidioides posadasii str. Silveira]|uniref:Anaphase-promoting complex subunit 2 n=1 Tax=Coccidioides posadasii (strain RMSCC 757 / Silveira) TaxID=443226 RepID=E9CUV8_COCPS|nr:anaphase-promoting complex subunit ApcB [Coccidioides posadasii str. Silveira]QVM07406.1 hypothetical protein D8B26_002105 [Coccidioides posadasii str. Silveira]
MFPNVPISIGRKRVFDSVFPPAPLSAVSPTPDITSALGYTQSSSLQKRPSTPRSDPDTIPEQVTWDRAWHTATAFLSIPDEKLSFSTKGRNDDDLDDKDLIKRWSREQRPSQSILDALFYVISDSSVGKKLRAGLKEYDLQAWYANEVRRHFLTNFRDTLIKELKKRGQEGVLPRIIRLLKIAQNIYYTPFLNHILPLSDPTSHEDAFTRLQQCLHSIVTYSLQNPDFSYLLSERLATEGLVILGIERDIKDKIASAYSPVDGHGEDEMDIDPVYSISYRAWKTEPSARRRISMMTDGEDANITAAREKLLSLLEGVQDVGLGGSKAQKVFAEVMNNLITEFIAAEYAGEWESPSLVVEHLRQWIENVFARLAVQVLHIFKPSGIEDEQPDDLIVTLNDVERWQEIGLARLGALRISELFEIIVEWDASAGAIEDLKHYTTNPSTRFYLTSTFSATLMNRLLHPGASTVDILQLYISIIRAFRQLDPRGVLLDRLARPIRRYLRERDDTVKVIVGGLLESTVDSAGKPIQSSPDGLGELAAELSKAQQMAHQENSGELDWDDMNWIPDPIDAAADYKKAKHSDVIGSLISLFDTKEVFVKELQRVLSDRLLKKKKDYDLEISVLELLKLRFGEAALQACDVMMRDVLDSKRVDAVIRADQKLESKQEHAHSMGRDTLEHVPELNSKILSRLFWPSLSDQNFKVPEEISSLQARYSTGFETLKPSRKLTWLNSLGAVTVELDLKDRVFSDEVTTWQASVIYSFQSPSSTSDSPVTKSVSELAEQLEMSPSLVRSACLFWLSKRILTESAPEVYSVLETLPDDEESSSQPVGAQERDKTASTSDASAAAAAAKAEAERESAEAAAMAKMNLYWQFIVGMLTNQGAMPLQRIIMMLKIAVPGGFPYSSEELREFLGKMVAKGKLEMIGGGNYKIISA